MKKNGLIKVLPLVAVAMLGVTLVTSCEKEKNNEITEPIILPERNVEKWECSDSSWFGKFTIYLDIYPDDNLMYTYYGYMDSNVRPDIDFVYKYIFWDKYWYKYHFDTNYNFPYDGNNSMVINSIWEDAGADTISNVLELFSVKYLNDSNIMYMVYHRHYNDILRIYDYYFTRQN